MKIDMGTSNSEINLSPILKEYPLGWKETNQFKGRKMVLVIAHIKNNQTGEIGSIEMEQIFDMFDIDEPSAYIWRTGNYSCDCNRHILWLRAKGQDIEGATELKCSEGKFSVNLENPVTNNVYYSACGVMPKNVLENISKALLISVSRLVKVDCRVLTCKRYNKP